MIGIVVVSHSPQLAQAAVDLALEMVHGAKPALAIAAGAGDGILGTDAIKVSEAIVQVASPDGVLVMTDLGSAVLSAQMAVEFLSEPNCDVRLTSAPFVEGLLAAVVRAAGGASLTEVDAEARSALAPKQTQLDEQGFETPPPASVPATAGSTATLTLRNPAGLHARPAAKVVTALARLDAVVSLTHTGTGRRVEVNGPTALLTLGARTGDVLEAQASGAEADKAIAELRSLFDAGFGELGGQRVPAPSSPIRRGGPIGVSPGRAVGPVLHMPPPLAKPPEGGVLGLDARPAAADRIAVAAAAVQRSLSERAAETSGSGRELLEATALLAIDPALLGEAAQLVHAAGESPERAVWIAIDAVADVLSAQGGMTAERVADLHDVRNRIVAELLGRPAPGLPEMVGPFVLVARDLAPADTVLLDPALCRALVTAEGGPTSHTAILARSLGLPAVVAAPDALTIPPGTLLLVDGTTGALVPDPDPALVADVEREGRETIRFEGVGRTADGHRVHLLANVGNAADAAEAAAAGAEGIGLFRTELCFLDRLDPPSIEEQVAVYREVLTGFAGRKVIVRTLDAGADKPLAFVTSAKELNPALGLRGIRSSWDHPDLLHDQLRAIAEAAAETGADVGVMAPMVSTAEEAADFARACADHGLDSAGVMIETPAAALTAERILAAVDFGSMGTNDLAQYVMAADRLVAALAGLNDPWQPAVLRVMQAVCAAAAAAQKPMGVCGEAAADPLLAAVLVGLGATSLSMSPSALGRVSGQIQTVSLAQCGAAAAAAVSATSPSEARAAAQAALLR